MKNSTPSHQTQANEQNQNLPIPNLTSIPIPQPLDNSNINAVSGLFQPFLQALTEIGKERNESTAHVTILAIFLGFALVITSITSTVICLNSPRTPITPTPDLVEK